MRSNSTRAICLVSQIKNGCGHIHQTNSPPTNSSDRFSNCFLGQDGGNHDGVLQFGEHAELNTTIRVSHLNAPLELDVAVQLDGLTHERFIRLNEKVRTTVDAPMRSSNKADNTVQEEKLFIQDRRQNQQRSAPFHDPSRKADCD